MSVQKQAPKVDCSVAVNTGIIKQLEVGGAVRAHSIEINGTPEFDACPGKVKGIVDVALPRPRSNDMESNQSFVDHATALRNLLLGDGRDG